MSALQTVTPLAPARPETLAMLNATNDLIVQCPQLPVATEHMIHGGMYARTIRLAPGTVLMGSLIKRATVLIIHGTVTAVGETRADLEGYNVLPGCAGRKQMFLAVTPVEMTMVYATRAQTVEQAEDEVFAEADQLMSRRDGAGDTFTITGE